LTLDHKQEAQLHRENSASAMHFIVTRLNGLSGSSILGLVKSGTIILGLISQHFQHTLTKNTKNFHFWPPKCSLMPHIPYPSSPWATFILLTVWVYLHTNRMLALKATEYRR